MGPPPAAIPKKRKIKPDTKMKNFNWTMLKYNGIKETIWQDIDDEKIKIDPKSLEEQFGAAQRRVEVEGDGAEKKPVAPKKQVINVLDMKRSQNIAIMLSRFGGMSYEAIRKAIIDMDGDAIPLENLQSLIQLGLPVPEEIEQLKEFVHTPLDQLGKAEGYMITVCFQRSRFDWDITDALCRS
jgi:hypothetical protein